MKIEFDPEKSEKNRREQRKANTMNKKPISDKSGEVRELTRDDIKKFKIASEVLPSGLLAILPKRKPGQRGKQKRPKKVSATIRYETDVLEYFRATGPGWQIRINNALKEWVEAHKI